MGLVVQDTLTGAIYHKVPRDVVELSTADNYVWCSLEERCGRVRDLIEMIDKKGWWLWKQGECTGGQCNSHLSMFIYMIACKSSERAMITCVVVLYAAPLVKKKVAIHQADQADFWKQPL